ncbi:hypothetical protein PYCCODRAFT_329796 [Trametes coccinea BRFM310]|uniref:Uncharacterized protein n=1 Tax=Trametes coccinea (strain BRFM310) TaxID=1353009 RepID=A0A1Y2IRS1_TRAC3|nr:hypothetical protein PYCCODRAFT_329796 [Trametes coccinea BRFM310]
MGAVLISAIAFASQCDQTPDSIVVGSPPVSDSLPHTVEQCSVVDAKVPSAGHTIHGQEQSSNIAVPRAPKRRIATEQHVESCIGLFEDRMSYTRSFRSKGLGVLKDEYRVRQTRQAVLVITDAWLPLEAVENLSGVRYHRNYSLRCPGRTRVDTKGELEQVRHAESPGSPCKKPVLYL